MNIDNGHLIDLEKVEWAEPPEELRRRLQRQGYVAIPRRLQMAADRELDGRAEAIIDLTAKSELARFAARERRRRKRRRKIAGMRASKQSRRRNRSRS